MQQHTIKITASNQPTTLEQLLRVVRYRGFKVDRVSMNVLTPEQMVDIQVNVQSKRPISLLKNQLLKLVDIDAVNIQEINILQAQVEA